MSSLVVRSLAIGWLVGGAAGCHATSTALAPAQAQAQAQLGASVDARAHRLRGPFDVEARRRAIGHPLPDPGSAPVPAPVFDIEGVSFYTDADKSVVDPALRAQNQTALEPLRAYVATVVGLADGWLASLPPSPAYAARAVDALAAWATAGALLGKVNHQGEFEREWTLGSLALAYLKVRDAPGLDPARRLVVQAWLKRIAEQVQPYYEQPRLKTNSNNHAYWTGMAVAATGIACDDRALFDWGLARARIGIAQIQPDGTLPLERDRRALALHYHVFALAPLVMLAELAAANDVPLYDEGGGAVSRLVGRVLDGFEDPISFGTQVGAVQDIKLPPRKTDLAWAEPYFARFHEPRLARWIAAARPLRDVRLGGDTTAAFGVPSP